MKKLFSLLTLIAMLFSFALAEYDIGTLGWEITFRSERSMSPLIMESLFLDETDPSAVQVDVAYTYQKSIGRSTAASLIPLYCHEIMEHASIYPECASVTLRFTFTVLNETTVVTFRVRNGIYEPVEATGLVLLLLPER